MLLDVCALHVVGELVVRERHARSVLLRSIVTLGSVGHGMQRHGLVLRVSDLVKVHVRNLLVLNFEGQVRGGIAGQLGEVL